MSELIVYSDLISQPCRAVELLLEINKVPYEKVGLNLLEGEHLKHPGLKAANPNMKLPTLQDGTFSLYESGAMLRYICSSRKLPDHWYPQDLKKRAIVDQYLDWHHTNIRKGSTGWFYWQYIAKIPATDPRIVTSKDTLRKSLDIFNDSYLKEKFILGAEISVADIQALSELTQHWMVGNNVYTGYANIERWVTDCVKELEPVFEKVYQKVRETKEKQLLGIDTEPLNPKT